MANLKNSLVASFVGLSLVAVLYGFTATAVSGTGKHTTSHWGAGAIGRAHTDVMSTTTSLGGGERTTCYVWGLHGRKNIGCSNWNFLRRRIGRLIYIYR